MFTSLSAWIPWIKLGGLVLLLLLGVLVAWWALFADRPRGRRRCPRCWYDLSWSPGMMCTECGHRVRRERDFLRTRRKTAPALLGLAVATIVGTYLIDQTRDRGGVVSVLPTRALILAMPLMGETHTAVFEEIITRGRQNELTDEHWLAVLKTCAAGDGSRRPPTTNWQASFFSRLATAAGQQAMTAENDDIRAAARVIVRDLAAAGTPTVTLATRAVWPAGVTPVIDAEARDWWQLPAQIRITATAEAPGAVPQSFVLRDAAIQTRSFSLRVPALPPGAHDVPIRFTFDRRMGDDEPWVAAGTSQVPVSFTVTDELVLEPVRGEPFDMLVAAAFDRGAVKYEDGGMPVRLRVAARQTFSEVFRDVAVGVRAHVLRNGRLGRQLDVWWLAGALPGNRQYAWEVPMWNDDVLAAPLTDDDEWQIRIEARPELALRVEGATSYWAGDVTVDIDVTQRRGPSPPRGWLPEAIAESDVVEVETETLIPDP